MQICVRKFSNSPLNAGSPPVNQTRKLAMRRLTTFRGRALEGMTSLSRDPFRFPFLPNAKFIGYVEPSGEGRSLVFPWLICGFDLQGRARVKRAI